MNKEEMLHKIGGFKMKKELQLAQLNNIFVKINKGIKNEAYYNKKSNNLIIFKPYDKSTNTESIYRGIESEVYNYLINELNNNNNLIVLWSQVEGTTSDYSVYYDLEVDDFLGKTHKEMLEKLPNLKELGHCKYVKIKDGKEINIADIDM